MMYSPIDISDVHYYLSLKEVLLYNQIEVPSEITFNADKNIVIPVDLADDPISTCMYFQK